MTIILKLGRRAVGRVRGIPAGGRSASRRARWMAGSALAALALAAPGLAGAQETASIPLLESFDDSGFYNTIKVTVGGGGDARVLLDTGSTGLYILADKAGPGTQILGGESDKVAFTYGYSSGNQLSGYYGLAPVAFPDASVPLSTGDITVGIVTKIDCAADKPDCPGWAEKQSGVMGVAYSALPDGEFNPLAQLGGNYGTGFIVVSNDLANPNVTPQVIVGLTAENTAGFTWTQFAEDNSGGQPAGLKAWNTKSIYTCFTVNNGSPGCYASVFDTGAEIGTFETGTSGDKKGAVATGSVVNTTVPGVMSYTTVAGDDLNQNGYAYDPPHGGTLGYNTGAQVFRYYVVAYDAINGRMGFAPLQNVLLGTIYASSDADLGVAGGGVYLGGTLVMSDGLTSSRSIVLGTGAKLEVDGSAALNGSLSGTEKSKLTMSAGSQLTLGGVSTYAANLHVKGGELTVNGYLPAGLQLDGATLSGIGTIGAFAAAKDSTVAPGNSVGTLSVLGSGAFASNSTYEVELGPNVTSDRLELGGTLYAAGTVALSLDGASPRLGQSYRIVDAVGGISGTFDTLAAPDFGTLYAAYPFLQPELAYGATTVDIDMERSDIPFAAAATTEREIAIALAADSASLDSDFVAALTSLNVATGGAALDALAGDFYPSLETVLQQQSVYLRDAAGARLRQAFAPAGAPAEPSGIAAASVAGGLAPTLWIQALGGWGSTASDGNADGVSNSIGGMLFGADFAVAEGWRTGFLGGINRSWVQSDGQPATATMDNYDVGLYAGTRQGAFAFDFGAGYSWHDTSVSRQIAFSGYYGGASGEWNSGTAQAFGEASWNTQIGGARVSPFAGLAYVGIDGGSLTETGSDAALSLDNGSSAVTYSTLGARLAAPLAFGDQKAMLNLTLGWQHAFGDLTPGSDLAFAGGSATVGMTGVPVAEDAALVEAGLAWSFTPTSSLGLQYSGQLAADAQQSLVTAQWETRF